MDAFAETVSHPELVFSSELKAPLGLGSERWLEQVNGILLRKAGQLTASYVV